MDGEIGRSEASFTVCLHLHTGKTCLPNKVCWVNECMWSMCVQVCFCECINVVCVYICGNVRVCL